MLCRKIRNLIKKIKRNLKIYFNVNIKKIKFKTEEYSLIENRFMNFITH